METNELSRYLQSLERDGAYRVDRVLKESPGETTERVFACTPDGREHGPYIRKRISRESGMGEAYERIWQANRAGRRFEHIPFIVDFHRTESDTVVVMEHVNGQTLADAVYERDAGVALAAELFPALCDAVSELHERFDPPIIHRDLKPGNVMLLNGVPVLIDFGIAREYRDAADADTTALGTRAYAPPEQFGYEQTTVRSDVYTLGLLLYYLLVEQTPTPKDVRSRFADARIPEPLRRVICYATVFDPKERYESAAELKLGFQDALAKCGAAPSPEPTVDRPPLTPPPRSAAQAPMPVTPPVPRAKGRVRNIAILVFLLLLVGTSWIDAFDPGRAANAYPAPFHQYVYLFAVPVCCAVLAYAGLDKDGLAARFPGIPWPRGGLAVGLGIGLFIALVLLALPFRALSGM